MPELPRHSQSKTEFSPSRNGVYLACCFSRAQLNTAQLYKYYLNEINPLKHAYNSSPAQSKVQEMAVSLSISFAAF